MSSITDIVSYYQEFTPSRSRRQLAPTGGRFLQRHSILTELSHDGKRPCWDRLDAQHDPAEDGYGKEKVLFRNPHGPVTAYRRTGLQSVRQTNVLYPTPNDYHIIPRLAPDSLPVFIRDATRPGLSINHTLTSPSARFRHLL